MIGLVGGAQAGRGCFGVSWVPFTRGGGLCAGGFGGHSPPPPSYNEAAGGGGELPPAQVVRAGCAPRGSLGLWYGPRVLAGALLGSGGAAVVPQCPPDRAEMQPALGWCQAWSQGPRASIWEGKWRPPHVPPSHLGGPGLPVSPGWVGRSRADPPLGLSLCCMDWEGDPCLRGGAYEIVPPPGHVAADPDWLELSGLWGGCRVGPRPRPLPVVHIAPTQPGPGASFQGAGCAQGRAWGTLVCQAWGAWVVHCWGALPTGLGGPAQDRGLGWGKGASPYPLLSPQGFPAPGCAELCSPAPLAAASSMGSPGGYRAPRKCDAIGPYWGGAGGV